jgi:hypothetical protein
VRDLILIVGILFCVAFAGMTATVAAEDGIDILTVTSFGIVLMIMLAIYGALKNPPRD